MATELTSAALARNASERDLDYISTCIGGNWEMLAPFLISKIPTATVEQIKEDHRKCQQRVFNLLLTWWRETDDPSLAHLFHLMYKAGTSVTIEWQHIAKLLEVQLRDIRACKTDYKPRVQELHAGQGKDTFLYSCKFDGRLIQLDKAQIKRLESTLDKEPIGEGGIGVVYRSNDLNLFGIPVAVKKIKIKKGLENHIRRERMACRLMHPFILPLLAYVEKSEKEFWFISPYCENGDLYAAIEKSKAKEGETSNNKQETYRPQKTRVKILLQIAFAIRYIHTEVPGVRDAILHKDIASKNVVLDKYLNARLIDFGLAREKDDDTATPGGRKYYEPPAKGHGKRANESWDYYSFGVIIREMLTSLGPEGPKGRETHYLKNMTKQDIEEKLDKNVWKSKKIIDLLIDISEKCLDERNDSWKVAEFKKYIFDVLKKTFVNDIQSTLFDTGNRDREKTKESKSTCHQCIINPVAEESSLTHESANCRQRVEVCIACEKNSFLNPITCYCGEEMTSAIGSKWGALLVAGDDDDQKKAEAMKREILELERVITSQAPRIIGISTCNIKVVVPEDGKKERKLDGNPAWKQIQDHITHFSEDDNVDTLLIYFSCHGGDKESVFQLGPKQEVKLDDFQIELKKLKNIDKLIVFLDRCFPPMIKLEDDEIRKFVQINACSDDKKAVLLKEGSMFTKFVIQGLKARSEEKECSKDCKICSEYWDTATEYISVCTLFDYVRKHIEEENKKNEMKVPEPDWQHKRYWKNFAFFTDEVVNIEFTSSRQNITLPLKCLKTIEDVKEELFKKFNVDKGTHEVEIHKETFRNDHQFDECDSLQKVMQAWIQRFPLKVSFREKIGI